MNSRQKIGAEGEKIAMQYLQSIGYKLYQKNVRLHRDEIDIIVYDPFDKVIVFAEVKSRSRAHADYQPELGLTYAKKKNIFRSARKWVTQHAYSRGYRIDLICVVGSKVVQHTKEISSAQ